MIEKPDNEKLSGFFLSEKLIFSATIQTIASHLQV